jgi:hypothetical protein
MKVNEYLPNLDVEVPVWLEALERFYRPWQMAYFRPFSNVISIKTSRAVRKNTSNMVEVRRWRHHVTSLQVLYWHKNDIFMCFVLALVMLVFASPSKLSKVPCSWRQRWVGPAGSPFDMNIWRAVTCSPQLDWVSDFTENHSLNVMNVKRYPVLRWVMNSSLSTKFRRVMVLESDHSPQKLRPVLGVQPTISRLWN